MPRVVLLQALERASQAQEAMRKARKVAPGESLDFWVALARNSYFSEAVIEFYSGHFIDARNATPE